MHISNSFYNLNCRSGIEIVVLQDMLIIVLLSFLYGQTLFLLINVHEVRREQTPLYIEEALLPSQLVVEMVECRPQLIFTTLLKRQ